MFISKSRVVQQSIRNVLLQETLLIVDIILYTYLFMVRINIQKP